MFEFLTFLSYVALFCWAGIIKSISEMVICVEVFISAKSGEPDRIAGLFKCDQKNILAWRGSFREGNGNVCNVDTETVIFDL